MNRTAFFHAAMVLLGGLVTVAQAQAPAARPPADDVLPREANQIWKQYDISGYTSRITETEKPEQAIVDWILRETGTEVWFSEPLGLLSANRTTLSVYHTPEMQRLVAEMVDRFVNSEAESHVFSMRLVTINSPNWRSSSLSLLRPVNVQSAGVDAWLASKENAAVLYATLSKRLDFVEHNSPNLLIHSGQSHSVSRTRPRNYIRSVRLREGGVVGHELEMGQIDEGYSLQFSPLVSLDERTIDAVIKCNIDQVEKFVPVTIDVPGIAGQQRVQIQVPQLVSWRLHERFRWPTDQVLILSCGVVAAPGPSRIGLIPIANPLTGDPGRADALLFIESKGKASQAMVEATRTANQSAPNYRGRY